MKYSTFENIMSQPRMSRYLRACSNDTGGQSLLKIFPAKPLSTPNIQYNNRYVFNELKEINKLRNRIAHHEPICFRLGGHAIIDTTYAKQSYRLLKDLFNWMQIDESDLLYGIDHVNQILDKIDAI